MNVLTISMFVAVLICSVASYFTIGGHNKELDSHWEQYKTVHKKKYADEHDFVRRLIWESNLKRIQKHNLEYDMGLHKYSMGMNAFGDLTFEEFKLGFLNSKVPKRNSSKDSLFLSPLNLIKLPEVVDWRTEGYVTEVKNQGQCGSCWSFSATGAIEGQYYRKTGHLENFSEQQLVDCSGNFQNEGCNGGLMDNAFDYVKEFGIEREIDYPYHARDEKCRYKSDKVVTKVTGHVDIPKGDEVKLKEAIATVGPVSVAIDAGHESFQFYRNGVYDETECSPESLDHGVLAVGYGELDGTPYWLVKNSWGAGWGSNGYIYMSRNKKNQCGIASCASYPLL